MQASFAKSVGGTVADQGQLTQERALVHALFGKHVKESDCTKCETTRTDADAREKYSDEGGKGKGCEPLKKRACCRFSHCVTAKQLADKARAAYPEELKSVPDQGRKAREGLLDICKTFMETKKKAYPLGVSKPDEPKSSFRVRERRERNARGGEPGFGLGTSAASHTLRTCVCALAGAAVRRPPEQAKGGAH